MMNLSSGTEPMLRIQDILQKKVEEGLSYSQLAEICNTTPATISKWVNKSCDLKWYSLLDICIGLDVPLSEILVGTKWSVISFDN